MGSFITWQRALLFALTAGALGGTTPAFAQANEQFNPGARLSHGGLCAERHAVGQWFRSIT